MEEQNQQEKSSPQSAGGQENAQGANAAPAQAEKIVEAIEEIEGADAGKGQDLEDEIARLRKSSEEYKETLQRLQAEFENAAKRARREKEEFTKLVNARLLEEFLPLVDSMNEAIKHAESSGNREMKAGAGKMLKQLMHVLERNGVRPIHAIGVKFDAGLHECLLTAKDEGKEDGTVLEEFAKGYTLNGKLLRPAKVKVNKKEQAQSGEQDRGA